MMPGKSVSPRLELGQQVPPHLVLDAVGFPSAGPQLAKCLWSVSQLPSVPAQEVQKRCRSVHYPPDWGAGNCRPAVKRRPPPSVAMQGGSKPVLRPGRLAPEAFAVQVHDVRLGFDFDIAQHASFGRPDANRPRALCGPKR